MTRVLQGAPRPLEVVAPSGGEAAASSTRALHGGERWYVAMTLPHKERYAAANLAKQGYRVYLPVQTVTSRNGRQFRTALAPVFPRYLFIAIDIGAQRWRSVNGTFGVRYLLCQGDCPLPVPDGAVEALLYSSDSSGRLIADEQVLAPGQRVRLLSGSFVGIAGVVERLDGPKRVQLLLEILGVMLAVTTSREAVTPV